MANDNLYQILFAENNPSPLFDYPDLLVEQLDKAQALVAMAMEDCFYDKPTGSQHLYLSNVDDAIYLSKVILSQWRKLMKLVLPQDLEDA